jgi:hypothetical protein
MFRPAAKLNLILIDCKALQRIYVAVQDPRFSSTFFEQNSHVIHQIILSPDPRMLPTYAPHYGILTVPHQPFDKKVLQYFANIQSNYNNLYFSTVFSNGSILSSNRVTDPEFDYYVPPPTRAKL